MTNVQTRYKTALNGAITDVQTDCLVDVAPAFTVGYGTFERGTVLEEDFKWTNVAGLTLTIMRGLSKTALTDTEVAGNKKAHDDNAVVEGTILHYILNNKPDLDEDNSFTGTNTFADDKARATTTADPVSDLSFPTKKYVDNRGGYYLDRELYYQENVLDLFTGNTGEGWASKTWANTDTGTYATNTTQYKVGGSSAQATSIANYDGIHYDWTDKDMAKFNNGNASTTADYINFVIYIATAEINKMAADGDLTINFHCDVLGSQLNFFQYAIHKANLVNGYNFFRISKATFSSFGSPDWAVVRGVALGYSSPGGTAPTSAMTWSIMACQMQKKDPVSAWPNIAQRNGAIEWNSSATSHWWLGKDNETLVLRDILQGTSVTSKLNTNGIYTAYSIQARAIFKISVANATPGGLWLWHDSNNWMQAYVNMGSNLITFRKVDAGVSTTISRSITSIGVGDIYDLVLFKRGTMCGAVLYLNNDYNTPYEISSTVAFSELLYTEVDGYDAVADIMYVNVTPFTSCAYADEAYLARDVETEWKNWTPTLTWGTAAPTGSVVTKARYSKVGNIVFFNFFTTATDGNAASSLTVSLPYAPKDNDSFFALNGYELYNTTTKKDPQAFIDDSASTIQFRDFTVMTDNTPCAINVSGFYEAKQ